MVEGWRGREGWRVGARERWSGLLPLVAYDLVGLG